MSFALGVSTVESAKTTPLDRSLSREHHAPRSSWHGSRTASNEQASPVHPASDVDGDGIDDADELDMARAYFPYYSIDPGDECARHGVVFRLTPHPADSSKIAVFYAVLYERDCGRYGLGAHVGDDEAFSALIDPKVPPPAGILALRAIAHQNTLTERRTGCGSLPGCDACPTADIDGASYPVVFASTNKHGQYVNQLACNAWISDLGACSLSPFPDAPAFVNAGEPDRKLCRDLTEGGFVTPANGWTEPLLMHFDPWSGRKFGSAGDVTSDLVDAAFLIDPSGC